MKVIICFLALIAVVSAQCSSRYRFNVLVRTSRNAGGLAGTVAAFRRALGGEDNGSDKGPFSSGQRSINWDAEIVPFDMPGNFFNTKVPRGALFSTSRGEFRVSNPPPPLADDRFNSIIPSSVSGMFVRFSLDRLFSPLFSNKFITKFQVAGKKKKATVSGFGAVFTDVDFRGKTKLTYFDKNNCKIATLKVPPLNRGLSFAGLVVVDRFGKGIPVIAKVKVTLGTISLWDFRLRYRGTYFADLVVCDDFIYGEPQPW